MLSPARRTAPTSPSIVCPGSQNLACIFLAKSSPNRARHGSKMTAVARSGPGRLRFFTVLCGYYRGDGSTWSDSHRFPITRGGVTRDPLAVRPCTCQVLQLSAFSANRWLIAKPCCTHATSMYRPCFPKYIWLDLRTKTRMA